VLHAKFYLFDSALRTPGGARISDTVMVGSSNMTSNAARVQWNDLYTVRGNPTLHAQYDSVFRKMQTDRLDLRTLRYATGPYQTTFTPVTPGTTDPTLTALRSIHCVGATGGTGLNGRTVVYINMHAWFGVRGYTFAKQVRSMYDHGCYVHVLYSFMSVSVFKKLTYRTGARMTARRTIFSKHGVNATLYSHFKNISVSGYVGTNHAASVVWTGSNNFTNDGLKFDEVTMRIASRTAFNQYRAQFAFITRTRSSATYASFAEPVGGGRAVR
jgi:HKD family nuclease